MIVLMDSFRPINRFVRITRAKVRRQKMHAQYFETVQALRLTNEDNNRTAEHRQQSQLLSLTVIIAANRGLVMLLGPDSDPKSKNPNSRKSRLENQQTPILCQQHETSSWSSGYVSLQSCNSTAARPSELRSSSSMQSCTLRASGAAEPAAD